MKGRGRQQLFRLEPGFPDTPGVDRNKASVFGFFPLPSSGKVSLGRPGWRRDPEFWGSRRATLGRANKRHLFTNAAATLSLGDAVHVTLWPAPRISD